MSRGVNDPKQQTYLDDEVEEEPGESDFIDEPDEPGLNNDFDWAGGD